MNSEPPPIPPPAPKPFGDPMAVQAQNRSAVGKGMLFGCGGCAVILVGIAGVFAAIFFISFSGLTHSEAVTVAISRAGASPQVQEALGAPIKRDWLTMGSVEWSNGDASADVRIPIKGPKGSAKIFATGYKKEGEEWVFTVLKVAIIGTQETINILSATSTPPAEAPDQSQQ